MRGAPSRRSARARRSNKAFVDALIAEIDSEALAQIDEIIHNPRS